METDCKIKLSDDFIEGFRSAVFLFDVNYIIFVII